jgi:hypothetical protein
MNDFSTCNDRDFLVTYIYDEYKTAHGIRPRWVDFDAMSMDELRAMAQQVSDDCDAQEIMEQEMFARNADKLEQLLADIMAMGAKTRETALRWLRSADQYHERDDDHFRYDYGLSWTYPVSWYD